ncbi:hypothetical protein HYH03_007807 [Edaphochlamys debaryana]|uniref:Pseudouridine synthase RsuA/RluA-like domain-containing protein n=1 Tax=Edaphochlamys debaryana TaxID=47281 RepID=A0A836C072_9CHLO|nr:hypothetical protein HYH03_007807 [Edaphochlamys debaryana]|eukprot:KAG2494173.1 hypothetical protein HYH03_007807 [Edaphochlamys debaryana]
MVVHIAPGHHSGTLVNALLHHCALPPMDLAQASGSGSGSSRGELDPDSDPDLDPDLAAGDELADDEGVGVGLGPLGPGPAALQLPSGPGLAPAAGAVLPSGSASASVPAAGGVLRPGIVHRLDKGTSGLMVVAKSEAALVRLQAQFKARTTDRNYVSITVGCPAPARGRVETNICRDPRDRKRMAAAPYGSTRGRTAASGYSVEAALAGGGAALVRWKLDTGRTHQIRVHAKHVGHPLLGDEAYGGTGSSAVASVARGGLPADEVRTCVEELGRPALHALTLGFSHPVTGERLAFEVPPPEDFRQALQRLGGHWPM